MPQGWNVTNQVPANFGTDTQSNSSYASLIQDRIITGVDTGTRNGYLVEALSIPTIIAANVVAAGDLEMQRDWDQIRQKHDFGCVDIYVRGSSNSQQVETAVYNYANNAPEGVFSSYTTLTLIDRNLLKFAIVNFPNLGAPVEQAVEIVVQRGGSTFYLGTVGSFIDNINGFIFLNPNEGAFQMVGNAVFVHPQPLIIAGNPATNAAAVNALTSAASGTYTISAFLRLQTSLTNVPTLQPIISVNSVTGNQLTGVVPAANIELVRTQDFLLNGGSQDAGDTVIVPANNIVQTTKNLQLTSAQVQIDTAMAIDVDPNGNVVQTKTISGQVVPSIVARSADLSTVYTYGVDYTISRTAEYNTWSFNWLAASPQNIPPPSGLNPPTVVFTYYKFQLYEQITLVGNPALSTGENITLTGTITTQLANPGFVHNVWLPVSYGNTSLAFDGYNVNPLLATGLTGAQVPYASRYIKVTLLTAGVPVVMREGIDFTLIVNATSGVATLARILTGAIPSGATVQVSYFYNETFSINTQYPAYVEQLANQVAITKHAAANVLIKAEIANPIDMTMVIELNSSTSPDIVDAQIRDVINIALDNVSGTALFMSEIVAQVMSVQGVVSVQLPLVKFAKSDGAYDIAVVIPTQTVWNPLNTDPAFSTLSVPTQSFITNVPVLPDATIPGGGPSTAYVGLLYQGQAFRRAASIQDFLTNSTTPSFYFIGTNDQISPTQPLTANYAQKILITIPPTLANPGLQAYFATYQVFGEGGAKDITISSTEYFVAGRIQLDYLTTTS